MKKIFTIKVPKKTTKKENKGKVKSEKKFNDGPEKEVYKKGNRK